MNLHGLTSTINKNSPAIFVALGIGGFAATVGMAIQATPKAMAIKEEIDEEIEQSEGIIQKTWVFGRGYLPIYAPMLVMGGLSIFSFVFANKIHAKRSVAALTAYSLAEKTLHTYQEKVVEKLGARKHMDVMDDIAKDEVTNTPPESHDIFQTGYGDTLCFDVPSGRYFRCSVEQVRTAENSVMKDLLTEMTVSLNDFYDVLGLPPVGVGDDLGWRVDASLPDIYMSSELDINETPVLVLNYSPSVISEYAI